MNLSFKPSVLSNFNIVKIMDNITSIKEYFVNYTLSSAYKLNKWQQQSINQLVKNRVNIINQRELSVIYKAITEMDTQSKHICNHISQYSAK